MTKLKYTEERGRQIAKAIRMGATYELAAAYAGVSADSLTRWRDKIPAFAEELTLAEGAAAIGWLVKIETAAAKDWRAAAWKLERRYPEAYGRQVLDQRLSGPTGGPIELHAVDYRTGLDALKPEDG